MNGVSRRDQSAGRMSVDGSRNVNGSCKLVLYEL